MISAHITSILLAIVFVVGCQGNNPFDRSSDPIKDYPAFEDDQAVVTKKPEQPVIDPADFQAPPQVFKERSYLIDVKGKLPDEPMRFVRGEEETYEIVVTNKVEGTIFSLAMAKNLDGTPLNDCASDQPCLRLLQNEGDIQTYALMWSPSRAFAAQFPIYRERIELEFVVEAESLPEAKAKHIDEPIKKLAIVLEYSDEEPVVKSIPQLDDPDISFDESQGSVEIEVQVSDVNASEQRRPKLTAGAFLLPKFNSLQKKDGAWVGRYDIRLDWLSDAYRSSGGQGSEFIASVDLMPISTASGNLGPKITRSFLVKLKPEPEANETTKEGSNQ